MLYRFGGGILKFWKLFSKIFSEILRSENKIGRENVRDLGKKKKVEIVT